MRNNVSTDLIRPNQIQLQEHQNQRAEPEIGGAGGEEEKEKEKARCEWDFNLCTVVSSSPGVGVVSDTIGVIESDPSDRLLATGGIARKIRIYRFDSLLPYDLQDTLFLDHTTCCDFYICTPAKLSSLQWKPHTCSHVVGSGDYDGVVMEYDLDRRLAVFERDEHGGRRVWSIDYSNWVPSLGASASDDGTSQIWDTRCGGSGGCVAVAQPSASRSPVCCVEFDPSGGPLVAIGCADRGAYVYDVRKMSEAAKVLKGHEKTVTYVRFIGGGKLVTAGTDGCLKMWEVEEAREIRTYRGHVNSRSFVGLSAWRNGELLGCGSESNEVFVYDKRWEEPVWVRGFVGHGWKGTGGGEGGGGGGFVSSVCWRQGGGGGGGGEDKDRDDDDDDGCVLVAGGSDGVLQAFVGKRRSPSSSS